MMFNSFSGFSMKVVWEQVGVYGQSVVCRQVGGWTQVVMGDKCVGGHRW